MKKANRKALSLALYNVSQTDSPSAAARTVALQLQNELGLDNTQAKSIRESIQFALEAIPMFYERSDK